MVWDETFNVQAGQKYMLSAWAVNFDQFAAGLRESCSAVDTTHLENLLQQCRQSLKDSAAITRAEACALMFHIVQDS